MDIGKVLSEAGILDEELLREMNRWGLPNVPKNSDVVHDASTLQVLEEQIVEALDEHSIGLDRVQDLDALRQYAITQRPAQLFLTTSRGKSKISVQVGTTHSGDVLIPWRLDSIIEEMLNGDTYLLLDGKRIYFNSVRDLFLGQERIFMLCTPSVVDHE